VETEFQRARRPEHKEQRREAILAAARKVATRDGVRSVSLGDIAAEVGVHKSALLRYFETREEIYLRLTDEGWHEWAHALHDSLDDIEGAAPAKLAATIAGTLAERPLFCDLLAHTTLNLERHVSREAVLGFKLSALRAVDDISALLARMLPGLGAAGGRDAIAAITALAASFWQTSHPPRALAELYQNDPRLGHAIVDFLPRLEKLSTAILTGLLEASHVEGV
jgi:AcrR family transcriptional regulator